MALIGRNISVIYLWMKSFTQYYTNPTFIVKRITPNSFLVCVFNLWSGWYFCATFVQHIILSRHERNKIIRFFFLVPKHLTGTYCDFLALACPHSAFSDNISCVHCRQPLRPSHAYTLCVYAALQVFSASFISFPFCSPLLSQKSVCQNSAGPPPPWSIHSLLPLATYMFSWRGWCIICFVLFFSVTRLPSIRLLSFCCLFSRSLNNLNVEFRIQYLITYHFYWYGKMWYVLDLEWFT